MGFLSGEAGLVAAFDLAAAKKALTDARAKADEVAKGMREKIATDTNDERVKVEAQIKAIREGCAGLRGQVNAGGNAVNPAGLDDPRCKEGGGTAAE